MRFYLPLWFEIAVLVVLVFIAEALAGIRRNIAVMGSRLETVLEDPKKAIP
jgi:hypothetical protein